MDLGTFKWPELIALASAAFAFVSLLVAGAAYWSAREANGFIRQQNLPTGYITEGSGGAGWLGLRVQIENRGPVAWLVTEAKVRAPRAGKLAYYWKVGHTSNSGTWTLDPPKLGQAHRALELQHLVKPDERSHFDLVAPDASLRSARELRISLIMRSVSTPRRQHRIEITTLRPEAANEPSKHA